MSQRSHLHSNLQNVPTDSPNSRIPETHRREPQFRQDNVTTSYMARRQKKNRGSPARVEKRGFLALANRADYRSRVSRKPERKTARCTGSRRRKTSREIRVPIDDSPRYRTTPCIIIAPRKRIFRQRPELPSLAVYC